MSEQHPAENGAPYEASLDLVAVHREYPGEVIAACDLPSPTSRMLCVLPATTALPHAMGQHLGWDRRGNLRGWPDRRGAK